MAKKILAGILAILLMIALCVCSALSTNSNNMKPDEELFNDEFLKKAKVITENFKFVYDKIEVVKDLYHDTDSEDYKNVDTYLEEMQTKTDEMEKTIKSLSSDQASFLGVDIDDNENISAINKAIDELKEWKSVLEEEGEEEIINDPSGYNPSKYDKGLLEEYHYSMLHFQVELIDCYWDVKNLDSDIQEIEENLAVIKAENSNETYLSVAIAISIGLAALLALDCVMIYCDIRKQKSKATPEPTAVGHEFPAPKESVKTKEQPQTAIPESTSKFCLQCGTKTESTSAFCPKCGRKLQ